MCIVLCVPCHVQLREAGDHTSYKNAPAFYTFLCDKYVSLARYFPAEPEARAEISEVRALLPTAPSHSCCVLCVCVCVYVPSLWSLGLQLICD